MKCQRCSVMSLQVVSVLTNFRTHATDIFAKCELNIYGNSLSLYIMLYYIMMVRLPYYTISNGGILTLKQHLATNVTIGQVTLNSIV